MTVYMHTSIYFILFFLMFAIPKCLTPIRVYDVTVKQYKFH